MTTNANIEKAGETPEVPQLSKWWKTDSCRQAFERAHNVKRASLERFLAMRQAHREALDREIWGKDLAQ